MTEQLSFYKELGETPLECIERFKLFNPAYKEKKMTYAGRLDPMAEGLLLVLSGNTKEKEKYLEWDKTYEFEVLYGFETDTYDILGLVTSVGKMSLKLEHKMKKSLKTILKRKIQSYPPYSSRPVLGKALHAWAREGRINEIEIPKRKIKIFSIDHIHTRLMDQNEMLEEILGKIAMVKGDFRQGEIIKKWKEVVRPGEKVLISRFRADVSSGTYIRSLAHEMGKTLGTVALAFNIKRTRVGAIKLP